MVKWFNDGKGFYHSPERRQDVFAHRDQGGGHKTLRENQKVRSTSRLAPRATRR
jgi:cold shock CspA family protein